MLKFGVELELLGNRSTMWGTITAVGLRGYDVRSDGSIRGSGGEIVTPILSTEQDLSSLYKLVTKLKENGCKVNTSCGLHVHIDANSFNIEKISKIYEKYRKYESVIDQIINKTRKDNRYCKSLPAFETIKRNFSTYNNKLQYGGDRYVKLNLAALSRHGTIEFRHHHGSVDAEEVLNWVLFCIHFVENYDSPGLFDGMPESVIQYYSKYTKVKPKSITKVMRKLTETKANGPVLDEAKIKTKAIAEHKRNLDNLRYSIQNDKHSLHAYYHEIKNIEARMAINESNLEAWSKLEYTQNVYDQIHRREEVLLTRNYQANLTKLENQIKEVTDDIESVKILDKELSSAEKLKKLILEL